MDASRDPGNLDQLVAACKRFNVERLDVFGSGARSHDFNPETSDADLLVVFAPGTAFALHVDLKAAFGRILGRSGDLLDREAIEASRNYIRRHHILSQAKPIYVA